MAKQIVNKYIDGFWKIYPKYNAKTHITGIQFYHTKLFEHTKECLNDFVNKNGYLPSFDMNTFNENIFFTKFVTPYAIKTFADKLFYHKYIARKYDGKHSVDILYESGSLKKILKSNIDFKNCFLKLNNGCGYNIKINSKQDIIDNMVLIENMDINYGSKWGEFHYSLIEKQYFIEKSVTTIGDPIDYRYYVFNGIPKLLQIKQNSYLKKNMSLDFYDMELQKIDVQLHTFKNNKNKIKNDEHETMYKIAQEIAMDADVPFIRVDFYHTDKVYCSEIAYMPANGTYVFSPAKYNYIFGQMWRKS